MGQLLGKWPLGRSWKDEIKVASGKIGCEYVK